MSYNLDKHIEEVIIALAKKHGVQKLILFGSRARETNHERSDIDIAVKGGDINKFAVDVEKEVDTLLLFDIINLDDNISEDLRSEIERDGVILYEELPVVLKKCNAYVKSLSILLRADRAEALDNEIYRMGVIGQFNLTFELSWKALREILIFNGVSAAITGSPREIIKMGYKFNFLSDENVWLEMLRNRNLSIHIYNEDLAITLVNAIFDRYIAVLSDLHYELQNRLENL